MKERLLIVLTVLVIFSSIFGEGIASEGKGDSTIVSEIRFGLLSHDVGVFAQSFENGVDINFDIFFKSPDKSFFRKFSSPRPMMGTCIHSDGQTSQVYGGLAWDFRTTDNILLTFGLGGAVHSGELDSDDPGEQRLGSRVLFRLAMNVGYHFSEKWNASFYWNHISNASLATPNYGLDSMGLQIGYVF
ncbi:acyloxyacyl hydrolase [Desulfosediminicola sp.]|uniref:acyloxyacyl hydrolase n=1 Tax=Desulfosediminicola sp. TaxID=2886825 RepID=UPI003AF29650